MKLSIITGIAGQDGTFLYKYLLGKNYSIIGVDIKRFFDEQVEFINNLNLSDTDSVFKLIKRTKPNEIYHLAAFHGSSEDKIENEIDLFKQSNETNVVSTINLLEAIRKYSPKTKLFYATSSQMFGVPQTPIQDENTPFNPGNIYGITKHAATKLCHYYRNKYNVFASVGIMYAHESPLRGPNFVSKKIVQGAVAIKNNRKKQLILGSLDTEVDWGYAGDYVVAMHKILQLRRPNDYIISSGEKHTVRDFVETVFNYLDLDSKNHVIVNEYILKSNNQFSVLGDNQKLIHSTGWRPKIDFKQLVIMMVEDEIEKLSNL